MSFFPILEAKPLPELVSLFTADPAATAPDETDLFLQELAIRIAQSGNEGVEFLLESFVKADRQRRKAILSSFGFVDRNSNKELLDRIRLEVLRSLSSSDSDLIAAGVDSANGLGFLDLAESIQPLLNHESAFVVGSVLRFLSAHFPSEAKHVLVAALKSPQPIVRQNAIDELDELECKEALPFIIELLNDPDKSVRDAAHWAVEHLEAVFLGVHQTSAGTADHTVAMPIKK